MTKPASNLAGLFILVLLRIRAIAVTLSQIAVRRNRSNLVPSFALACNHTYGIGSFYRFT